MILAFKDLSRKILKRSRSTDHEVVARQLRETNIFLVSVPITQRASANMMDHLMPHDPKPLPFENLWVECLEDHFLLQIKTRDRDSGEKQEFRVSGIWFQEASPRIITLGYPIKKNIISGDYEATTKDTELRSFNKTSYSDSLDGYLGELFSFEKDEVIGSERINYKEKIKTKNGNKLLRIKKIIHLRKQSETIKNKQTASLIQWSHCWEVMGHWRKTSGVGKNSAGNYCVKGMTWINPHKKGEGEFIKKIRIK